MVVRTFTKCLHLRRLGAMRGLTLNILAQSSVIARCLAVSYGLNPVDSLVREIKA